MRFSRLNKLDRLENKNHLKERELRFSISKASYYSIDEFVEVLRELTDLPPIDHFNIKKKYYFRQFVIFIAHRRDAFKRINKIVVFLKNKMKKFEYKKIRGDERLENLVFGAKCKKGGISLLS